MDQDLTALNFHSLRGSRNISFLPLGVTLP